MDIDKQWTQTLIKTVSNVKDEKKERLKNTRAGGTFRNEDQDSFSIVFKTVAEESQKYFPIGLAKHGFFDGVCYVLCIKDKGDQGK